MPEKSIRLSPSKLNVFRECPRCFWNAEVADVSRPRGPFPSLPGGIDLRLKDYLEAYRGKLPPELRGKVPGILFKDPVLLRKWRNWRTGLGYYDPALDVEVIGALDDVLQDGEVMYPLDYKTKGASPKDDGSQYYQTQLDVYQLFLASAKYKVAGKGYLVYYWPMTISAVEMPAGAEAMVPDYVRITFGLKVFALESSADRAKETIEKAVKCIRGPQPDPSDTCEYCNFTRGYAAKSVEKQAGDIEKKEPSLL